MKKELVNLVREGEAVFVERNIKEGDLVTCFVMDCWKDVNCFNCICADENGDYAHNFTIEELEAEGRVKYE